MDRQLRDLSRHEILARIAARQRRLDEGAPTTATKRDAEMLAAKGRAEEAAPDCIGRLASDVH